MSRYLVVQLARFGDLVQTKRLVASLLAEGAEVYLCIDRSLASLAKLLYPDCQLHPVVAHASGLSPAEGALAILTDNRATFARLSAVSFDRVFNLNFSGMSFQLAALFDPQQVSGYRTKDGQPMITRWPAMAMRWARDRRLGINLIDFWGSYAPRPIGPESVNPAAEGSGGGIGVVLAGRESRRSLPVDTLARVAKTLAARHGSNRLVLLGSTAEEKAARSFVRQLGGQFSGTVEDLCGKTDWAGLVGAVGELDLLITPDTGTMHLAAHLGVPVAAFFLSSAWCFETGPYGTGHTIYQAVTDCLPCLETHPCPYDVRCLAPLASQPMLRFLSTGRKEHCPDDLVALSSSFDALGCTYIPIAGELPQTKRRREFRLFIADHLGLDAPFEGPSAFELARAYYQDHDWMV